MPELPEVETIKRGLSRLVVGKKILEVTCDTFKSFPNPATEVDLFLSGTTIVGIHRRARVFVSDIHFPFSRL